MVTGVEPILRAFQVHGGIIFMNDQQQELIDKLFGAHNRRDFLKRAGALGLSGAALTAFLDACGSAATSTTTSVNLSNAIDVKTLAANAKKEGILQAVGITPEWANHAEILRMLALSGGRLLFSRAWLVLTSIHIGTMCQMI